MLIWVSICEFFIVVVSLGCFFDCVSGIVNNYVVVSIMISCIFILMIELINWIGWLWIVLWMVWFSIILVILLIMISVRIRNSVVNSLVCGVLI